MPETSVDWTVKGRLPALGHGRVTVNDGRIAGDGHHGVADRTAVLVRKGQRDRTRSPGDVVPLVDGNSDPTRRGGAARIRRTQQPPVLVSLQIAALLRVRG